MNLSTKSRLLGFYAAAQVRLSREQKKPKNIISQLLKFGLEIFGMTADTVDELADKIADMGASKRRQCCRKYIEKQSFSTSSPVPQSLKLPQNKPGYIRTLPAVQTSEEGPKPELSSRKLRKLYLAARKAKRDARKERRRDALNAEASKPRITRRDKSSPSEQEIRNFYSSWEWARLSFEVKKQRGRQCECCGAQPPKVRIITDHIKPLRHYWHLRLSPSNMQVLCDDCNRGKGSWDETDFRPSEASRVADRIEEARSALDGPMPSADPVIWN